MRGSPEGGIEDGRDHFAFTETASSALSMLPAGARLAGRYRILGVVGAGGMGVVYHAHDEELDTPVALKVLRPERRPDEAALQRFRDEIRLARKVTHPSVVRIHDIGQDANILFFTMDYVEGRSLREALADGPLPAKKAVLVARRLAEGLAAAHEQGVVHRDVKPDNVIVADDGRAWLTDFGIARAIGGDRVTREGRVAGTPDYLSPEQIRGEEIDGRSDIFALGLLLHEMLTGEVPLRGDTIEETAARRAAGRSADLRALNGVSPGIRRIVARCLEPKPADRYESAADLAQDLARGGADLRVKSAIEWIAALGAVVLTIGIAAWLFPRIAPDAASTQASETKKAVRIAVLPLGNSTGRSEYDWVRRGLSESLAGGLAENPELQVVDSLRVFRTIEALRLSDDRLDGAAMRQLAALLEVSQVVSGSLVGDAQSLRLEFVLRRLPDGAERQVRVDVDAAGLLPAADKGVARLSELLRLPARDLADAPALSENVAAMTAYDSGMALLARGESVLALEPLKKSAAEDSEFGLAWTALARANAEAGRRAEALDAAEKAVGLFEGQSGRAALRARAEQAILAGDPKQGVALLEDLVERYPNDVAGQTQLAEQLGELGRFDEARTLLQSVVEADPNHPRAWFLLGKFAIISGDARLAAEDYLVRALVVQNRIGSAQGRGEVFNAMGIANEQLGELEIARQYYRNALEMRNVADDKRGVAASLSNIARLDMINGKIDAARAGLQQSLKALEEVGDTAGVADMQNEFGVLEEEAGDYAAALSHYREALRIRRQLGGGLGLAESYANLAFIYLTLGEYDNAAAFASNALDEYKAAGSARGRMTVLEIEGKLNMARGDFEGALRAFVAGLDLAREQDSPFSEAVAEGGLGRVAHYQGRPKAAFEAWDRALELLKPLDDRRGIAEFELARADLFLDLNLPRDASAALGALAEWLPEEGNVDQRAEYRRLQGILAAIEGRNGEAAGYFDKARALVERTGSEALIVRMELSRQRWLKPLKGDPRDIADRAIKLGNAPMRLEALELVAASRLAGGENEAALSAARSALRPPFALDPWIGNWRLNWLASQAEEKLAPDKAAASRDRASAELASLIEAVPEALRHGLAALPEAEALDVAAP